MFAGALAAIAGVVYEPAGQVLGEALDTFSVWTYNS